MIKEAKARILINNLLTRSGWRFFDEHTGPANVALEAQVKIKKKSLDDLGDDFEKTANGYVAYLLLDARGFPIAVLEAKSEKFDPLVGKEQTRKYAHSQNVRFVLLSNGNLNYFWDLEQGNPALITELPTPESLDHFHTFQPNPDTLVREQVKRDYVAVTQNPNYASDPRWINPGERENYIKDTELKFLRPYQLRAIAALQDTVSKGGTRFLFEMATGTGKTLTAAAVIKLFMRTGNAKRVLFLVDRIELENQAWKVFVRYLRNDLRTVIYKEYRDDWCKAEIVVSTVQSLQFNNKYQRIFSPTDFDLVISDEAHRSIGGNSRAVFEYFIGDKLGLTATPKDYLKKIDPARISQRDPREWERRPIIFQSQNAYKNLRRMLMENYLWAVVSLPAGVFNPYSGVKTSILFLDKNMAKRTSDILFVKVVNDGFDLGAQRRPLEGSELPEALKILDDHKKAQEPQEGKMALTVSRERLLESPDCNLSGDRYRAVVVRRNGQCPMVRLGDERYFRVESGGTPSSKKPEYWNGYICWATLVDLPSGDIFTELRDTQRKITDAGLAKSSVVLLPPDAVLVSSRATIGRIAIASVSTATNQGFKNVVITDRSAADPRYFAYAITRVVPRMKTLASGGNSKKYRRQISQTLRFPSPPGRAGADCRGVGRLPECPRGCSAGCGKLQVVYSDRPDMADNVPRGSSRNHRVSGRPEAPRVCRPSSC